MTGNQGTGTAGARAPAIGVLGSYGGINIGDESILTCVLGCLRACRPDARLVVFSRNPEHTRAHHGAADAVTCWEGISQQQMRQSLSGLDLLVLGGGGVLYDSEARRYLRLVSAAQDLGVRTFAYAVGAGPLREPDDRKAVRTALAGMDDVVVRDDESRLVLEEAGVQRDIAVTADPAMMLAPAEFSERMLRYEGIPDGARLVAMSVREPGRAAEHLDVSDYHALLADVADFLVRRLEAHVVFMPMERQDVRHAHAVLSHMTAPDQGRILHGEYSPPQFLGFMRHVDLAVGMRLHFLIFAALSGVPFLPLPYAGKVFDFARRLGAPALVGVAREQAGLLIAELDRLWDEYPKQRDQVRTRVAELRELSRVTCGRCAALLADIDAAAGAWPMPGPGEGPSAGPDDRAPSGPGEASLAGPGERAPAGVGERPGGGPGGGSVVGLGERSVAVAGGRPVAGSVRRSEDSSAERSRFVARRSQAGTDEWSAVGRDARPSAAAGERSLGGSGGWPPVGPDEPELSPGVPAPVVSGAGTPGAPGVGADMYEAGAGARGDPNPPSAVPGPHVSDLSVAAPALVEGDADAGPQAT
ncbi:polysaccharide pyruvyl transferase family protein [Streptomyces sp. NPDC002577]